MVEKSEEQWARERNKKVSLFSRYGGAFFAFDPSLVLTVFIVPLSISFRAHDHSFKKLDRKEHPTDRVSRSVANFRTLTAALLHKAGSGIGAFNGLKGQFRVGTIGKGIHGARRIRDRAEGGGEKTVQELRNERLNRRRRTG